MPISTILLLTGENEGPVLTDILCHARAPAPAVRLIHRQEDLERIPPETWASARLLAFCSGVIVPAAYLARLPGPAYNFHPGPPERPGRYPSVFALFEDASQFGITVHEMRPAVDSGPIVVAEWFNIPKGCDLAVLESLTLSHLGKAFIRLAPYMAAAERPLPHLPIAWSGRKTNRADCIALCTVTADMDDGEVARRRRCCGTLIAG